MQTLRERRADDDTPPYGLAATPGRDWGVGAFFVLGVLVVVALGTGWLISGAGGHTPLRKTTPAPETGQAQEQTGMFGEPITLDAMAVTATDTRTELLAAPDTYRVWVTLTITARQDGVQVSADDYYLLMGTTRVQPTDFTTTTPILSAGESALAEARFAYRGADATFVFAPGGRVVARWSLVSSPANRRLAEARAERGAGGAGCGGAGGAYRAGGGG
jgi:hypothetical protein